MDDSHDLYSDWLSMHEKLSRLRSEDTIDQYVELIKRYAATDEPLPLWIHAQALEHGVDVEAILTGGSKYE